MMRKEIMQGTVLGGRKQGRPRMLRWIETWKNEQRTEGDGNRLVHEATNPRNEDD